MNHGQFSILVDGSMKINDKEATEGVVAPKALPANGISVRERFKLAYFGSLVIDKRYTSCMLPWIVAEIKRKCQQQTLDVAVGNTQVIGTLKENIVEHSLTSISKCIKLEGKDASTFAYLTKDPKNSTTCSCHVYEAENTTKASKFLMTLKKALEDCKRQHPVKEFENLKSDCSPCEKVPRKDVSKHAGVQYEVTYIGKLAVSHRRAPPTLIDTSVERFRHHNQQILLTSKLHTLRAEQKEESDDTDRKRLHPPVKAFSFDGDRKQDQLSDDDLSNRPRSVSDAIPMSNDCLLSSSSFDSAFSRPTRSGRRLSFPESRSLLMHISINSVLFSSSVSGKVLMERKVQEISFCQQGTSEPEHFGFICHDAKSSTYHCYVFRAESKLAVDNIMKSLKQAFNSAWQAVGSTAACENCPLHKLHRLCQSLEGEKPVDQEVIIRHHLIENFGNAEVEELRKKFQAEAKRRDVVEKNEIAMSLLREFYEQMQKVHKHSPNEHALQIDSSAKEKPGNKFIAKAKRSLGDIFGRSKSRSLKSDLEGASSDEADAKCGNTKPNFPAAQRKTSATEKPELMENITEAQPRTRAKRTHRRSYSDTSQVFTGPNRVVKDPSDSRDHVSDEETFVIEHPRRKNSSYTSTPKNSVNRKQSYRRAIFDSVVTPSKLPKNAEGLVPCSSAISEDEPVHQKKSRDQLRGLWRKAIMEQRILIRMEKENSKLRAGEGIAKNKRLKLEYDELLPRNNSTNETWNKLLATETLVEKSEIVEAVKCGVPKNRRGEIWQFLLKQDLLRNKHADMPSKKLSYKELKEMASKHQHAILIDCNRTFPSHPYFSQQVGVGQFALFNLLKVYSNLDPELGYCQGLSFVAGLLLMHLGEEEAFGVLKHLNFNYGLRKQYMPDMAGLRVQFYQYSRLLHDAYPSLHDHFKNFEVTPALYVASWFLTIFASLFPVSFACRILDLLCLGGLETIFKVAITLVGRFEEKILACESLETIVHFLKIDLPKLAVDEQESIVSDALAMDIGDQLLRFEVEYQVFQEDEVNPSLVKPLLKKIEKLSEENRKLKSELKQAHRKEKNLLDQLTKIQAEKEGSKMLGSKDDKNAVTGGDDISYSPTSDIDHCRSTADDNTDSFEHIIGAEETDDDIDALSCDSPLTIEDSVCDKSNSLSTLPSEDSDHKWTKL